MDETALHACSADAAIDARLAAVRAQTRHLCDPLETEDFVVQPLTEVSPPKWHLAHTSWFFEQFILQPHLRGYRVFDPAYAPLFNSYYKSVGPHWPQSRRGTLSRPTVREIFAYRSHVDAAMTALLRAAAPPAVAELTEAGIQHEQQHQELLLMDIKAILGANPSMPRYSAHPPAPMPSSTPSSVQDQTDHGWALIAEGVQAVGADKASFSYDNERPRHRVWLAGGEIARRMVSNGEYRDFIEDGGYEDPRLWTSKGWDWAQAGAIGAPLYWLRGEDGAWREFTLAGAAALDEVAPVMHVSWFEADAYARWRGCRLPTEQEYEIFLAQQPPSPPRGLWCWTASQYSPYPGFRPFTGPLAEYNGKFMCNQFVLRGGCFATPRDHYRISYRNFYEPQQRWMFSGIRLARG